MNVRERQAKMILKFAEKPSWFELLKFRIRMLYYRYTKWGIDKRRTVTIEMWDEFANIPDSRKFWQAVSNINRMVEEKGWKIEPKRKAK